MTIISKLPNSSGQHKIMSQSGRNACWLEGFVEVPDYLEEEVWASLGWCDLTLSGDTLTNVQQKEKPAFPPPEPTLEEQRQAVEANQDEMLLDQEYRLTVLELGI